MTNGRAPLTIQQATDELGVADKTIRRWLQRGVLEKHSEEHGRILITAESVDRAKARMGGGGTDAPAAPSARYDLVPAAHLEAAQRTAETLSRVVQDQAAYIRELQERIAALEAQQRYSGQMEDVDRTIRELRAEIAAVATGQPVRQSPDVQTPEDTSVMRRILRKIGL